jgi:hypothetical protein
MRCQKSVCISEIACFFLSFVRVAFKEERCPVFEGKWGFSREIVFLLSGGTSIRMDLSCVLYGKDIVCCLYRII